MLVENIWYQLMQIITGIYFPSSSWGPPLLLLEDDRLSRKASPGGSFAPKRTSPLGSLNEPTMSTHLRSPLLFPVVD